MSNLDVIRERLDGDKYADLKEVASTLLAALESIEHLSKESKGVVGSLHSYVHAGHLDWRLNYWLEELAVEPVQCAKELHRATLETPAEHCEEEAVPGSEYCKEHDV